jgi:hypothetical protein
MYYGEEALFNDEQRVRIKEATRLATQGWRFRNVKPYGVRVMISVARAVRDAVRRGIDAARSKIAFSRNQRSLTLTEQR